MGNTELDKWLRLTIQVLRDRLNREPSEEEIMSFIFDDESHKQAIWNSNAINSRIAELEAEYPNPELATIQDEPDTEIREEYAQLIARRKLGSE